MSVPNVKTFHSLLVKVFHGNFLVGNLFDKSDLISIVQYSTNSSFSDFLCFLEANYLFVFGFLQPLSIPTSLPIPAAEAPPHRSMLHCRGGIRQMMSYVWCSSDRVGVLPIGLNFCLIRAENLFPHALKAL